MDKIRLKKKNSLHASNAYCATKSLTIPQPSLSIIVTTLSLIDRPPPHPLSINMASIVTWQFCVLVTLSLSYLRSNNRVGDFMKFLFCLFACVILLVLICFKFVLHVFTKMLELYSMCLLKCSRVTRFVGTLFWVTILSKRLNVIIIKFNMFSTLQMNCQHMIELVISKTIYNQNGRTPTTISPKDGCN